AGRGDEDVGLERPRLFEHDRLTGVAVHDLGLEVALEALDQLVVDLDQRDLVAGGGQRLSHLDPEAAGAGDDDPHWPNSLSGKLRNRPSEVDATTKLTTSPVSIGVAGPGTIERPPRVTSITWISPSTLKSASLRPS